MSAAIVGWLEEANLHEGQLKVAAQGPLSTTSFVVSFEGSPQTAARRAAQALEGIRSPSWRQQRRAAARRRSICTKTGASGRPRWMRSVDKQRGVSATCSLRREEVFVIGGAGEGRGTAGVEHTRSGVVQHPWRPRAWTDPRRTAKRWLCALSRAIRLATWSCRALLQNKAGDGRCATCLGC